jgi:hypothetical protein
MVNITPRPLVPWNLNNYNDIDALLFHFDWCHKFEKSIKFLEKYLNIFLFD